MRVALGTAQFGMPYGLANQTGQVRRSEAQMMLELATRSGIDTLDTAVAYGDSEACLGAIGVRSFKVVTKLPAIPTFCKDVGMWVREQVDLSLRRLDLSSVYGLLLHRPADLLSDNGTALWHAIEALRDDGLIQKVGVSIYAPAELEQMPRLYQFSLVQAPLNIIDRRISSSGWLDRLKDNDVEIHTRSVFLQGLLLMPAGALPSKFLRWESLFARWHQWLSANNASAIQACLNFALGYRQVDRVVVGADGVKQLHQIIAYSNGKLAADFPDMELEDDLLVNPALWRIL